MLLRFKVSEQNLVAVPTRQSPRVGSKDYLQLQFEFSEDWQKYDKVLYLQHEFYSTPITLAGSGPITIPAYYTQQGSFALSILGQNNGERIPTNTAFIHLAESGEMWETEPPDPAPGWVEELQTLYTHPPIAGPDGTWMMWNVKTEEYEASKVPLPQGPKGDPGYTPQKGVDYNDGVTPHIGANKNWFVGDYDTGIPATGPTGKAGYTPIKGVDYNDGYTPVKGIDYDDGVSVTHTWDGTKLTVTSASGTSSADLRGEKGDRGEQGVRGIQGIQGEPGYTPQKGVDYNDGVSVTHEWDGSKLVINSASGTSSADLRGPQGIQGVQGIRGEQGVQGVQGVQGERGEPFRVLKTYTSVAEMNADHSNTAIPEGGFVMIVSDVEDEDNASLYCKNATGFTFIVDMSGMRGIQGERGPQGIQGIQGERGIQGEQGIQGIQGEPGLSATHEWNGTTLTMTSASGTSSADLRGEQGIQGVQGIQGEPGISASHEWDGTKLIMTSASGTSFVDLKGDRGEQGVQGDQGIQGEPGVSVTHKWDGTTLTVTSASGTSSAELKGERGDRGEQGIQGVQGIQGEQGLQGERGVSILGVTRTSGTGAPGTTDTYTVSLSDGSYDTFTVYNGANGEGSGDMMASLYDPQNKATDIYAYTDQKIAAIPTPDVSGQINAHNAREDAHPAIQQFLLGIIENAVGVAEEYIDSSVSGHNDDEAAHPHIQSMVDAVQDNLNDHITDKGNPHAVTYTQVGADKAGSAAAVQEDVDAHLRDMGNPHKVTYEQVGADQAGSAAQALEDAKKYTDEVKSDLLNGADAAFDSLKELADLITENQDAIDALEELATSKVDKTTFESHTGSTSNPHKVTAAQVGAVPTTRTINGKALSADISLKASDVGAADSSHGTHVEFSTTAPVADGSASVGSATTVARSDHKHPTDTSRAAASDLSAHTGSTNNPHGVTAAQVQADPAGSAAAVQTNLNTHDGNTTKHITATERSTWNAKASTSAATTSAAGLMSAADKVKLDGIAAGANAFSLPYRLQGNNAGGTGSVTNPDNALESGFYYVSSSDTNRPPFSQSSNKDYRLLVTSYGSTWLQQIATDFRCDDIFYRRKENGTWKPWVKIYPTAAASTSAAGLMSAADKTKLDGIAANANNYTYTLPAATSSALGGVKVGSNISNSSGTISLTKANVTAALGYTPPTSDTNTTYSAGTGISLSGTTFSNSGVRSVATGSSNGTISVNTNGTSADVAVKGLGSAAYTASSDYAPSSHTHDYLPESGGTLTGSLLLSSGSTAQSGQPAIKWASVSSKTPYHGYCTGSSDATFVVGSLTGSTYQTGLAIGGSSGNLLWKGAKVATADDLSSKANSSTVTGHTGDTTVHITAAERTAWNAKASTSAATTSAAGLMSAADKTKLNYTNVAYGTCSTAAATAAKVVTLSGNTNWALTVGSVIVVKFDNTNSAANATLNVNSTGAYPIWYNNAEYTSGSSYAGYAARPITYMFNGTHWVFVSWSYDANTQSNTNSTDTSSKIFIIGATSQGSNKTTYSHDTAYVGTDGCLYSNSTKVSVEGHTHTAASVGAAPSSHTQAASTVTAGTLGGQVKANATAAATVGTAQVRNISAGTSDLTAGSSALTTGDIYFVYE